MPRWSKPNIVLILIDDLGARDLGCFGSSFYETPNLDRLAEAGVRFDRAYASAPVCSPTRAAIMSGKYPARVGITQWIGGHLDGRLLDVPYLHHLPTSETSLATALRDGGYQTWHVGKWHLGDKPYLPENHGFDINIAGRHQGSPNGPNGYWGPYNIPGYTGPAGEYLTDRITRDAVELLQRRDTQRPFFLNLWHYAVHTPLQAPPELVDKYKDKAKRLGLDRIDPIQPGELMELALPDGQKPRQIMRRMFQSHPIYAAMIENLDANIGRLVDAIAAEGELENTIFVFTSDNGGLATSEGSPTCNHPLAEGKGWCYEGGNRVCQFITWHGKIRPGFCDENVTSTDIYPTLLDAAALPARPEQHIDGKSLWPLLNRTAETLDRDFIFWHYPHYSNQGGRPGAAVVSGDFKLIWHFEDDRCELFDLKNDVSESRNLAPTHPEVVGRLKGSLESWQRDARAAIPRPNPAWPAKTAD